MLNLAKKATLVNNQKKIRQPIVAVTIDRYLFFQSTRWLHMRNTFYFDDDWRKIAALAFNLYKLILKKKVFSWHIYQS